MKRTKNRPDDEPLGWLLWAFLGMLLAFGFSAASAATRPPGGP